MICEDNFLNLNIDNVHNDDDNTTSSESILTDLSSKTNETGSTQEQTELFCTKTDGDEFYGEVLKNRYLIIKKLGYGAFSSVWMAYDVDKNKLVAIKIINPNDFKSGILELKIYLQIASFNNPYLLTMNDYFQVKPIHPKYKSEEYLKKNKTINNHIVIILPLMACSVENLLQCSEYELGLPLSICKQIIIQTVYGVKELEAHNLMHTDLKPENILVCGLNKEAELLLEIIKDININQIYNKKISLSKDKNNMWKLSYDIYKEITKTIIKFIDNEFDDINKQMDKCLISSKYLENIKIKLCDFNSIINIEDKVGSTSIEIQTRYYRAPEIILGSGLHKKSDYWSLACIFFEILTGDILFDPDKNDNHSRDIQHLYLIEELLGPIPKHMIDNGENSDKLYDDKYHLKNVNAKIKQWDLKHVLQENYDNIGLSQNIIDNIIIIIKLLLSINPNSRPSIKNIIKSIQTIKVTTN